MTNEKMTMEDMVKHGQRLFQSAENLKKSARDLVALNDSILTYLKDLDLGDYQFELEKSKHSDEKNEWCRMAQSFDIDVKESVGDKSKKQTIIGTITVITRLCDFEACDPEAPKHPWNEQACIIVGWHKAEEWERLDLEDAYWGIDSFDPENAPSIHHRENGLWAWKDEEEEDQNDNGYFFALPIFSVTNESLIKRWLLKPLVALFNSANPATTAATVLKEIPVLLPSE